tara:strand:+ start:1692 stop:1967 length:276 start_codon:yes stop_codon:yes gene_type:complete
MNVSDDEIFAKKEEFSEFLEKASNKEYINKKDEVNELIHPNSLITKNISLFTKNPNYKLLTWLIIQILIFTLFIDVVVFFKNHLVPYINSF